MSSKTDVLILGCGISGIVAALKLIKENFDVVLIEPSDKVGANTNTKIDITENIGLNPIIDELDLSFLDRSNKSTWVSKNNSFTFQSKISDLFVKRGPENDSFDVRMANKVRDKGGEIRTKSHFKGFGKEDGNLKFAKIKSNTGYEKIKADFFVDASGGESNALKKMGLNKLNRIGRKITGYGVISDDFELQPSETNIFLDSELAPGGYFYLAKANDGLGVACLVLPGKNISLTPEKQFWRFVNKKQRISSILERSEISNHFSGGRWSGILPKRVRNNFCAVGDSAFLLEPLFGYGVRPAVLSGYLAAEHIKKVGEAGSRELIGYDKKLKDEIISKQRKMFFLREIFEDLDDEDFDFILESLNRVDRELDLDDLFDESIGRQISIFAKTLLIRPFSSGKIAHKAIKNLV